MTDSKDRKPIVSSAHLVSGDNPALSEIEFGLIIASNAFDRWITRCANAAGLEGLGPTDVLVLHSINHKDRTKKLADLCLVLNIEDTHVVAYATRKLVRAELIEGHKRGKEVHFSITEKGRNACAQYRDVREACLIDAARSLGLDGGDLSDQVTLLRALSGLYDQAARAATTI